MAQPRVPTEIKAIDPRNRASPASVAGRQKAPDTSLVGAASDRTSSFSVCTFAVELGPHHGSARRYSPSAAEASGPFSAVHYPHIALTHTLALGAIRKGSAALKTYRNTDTLRPQA
jgi:hypothetical protein